MSNKCPANDKQMPSNMPTDIPNKCQIIYQANAKQMSNKCQIYIKQMPHKWQTNPQKCQTIYQTNAKQYTKQYAEQYTTK